MSSATTNEDLQILRSQVISAGVGITAPVYVESATGAILRDIEGKEVIDFAGGIAVMNIGHSHPRIAAAIKDQAEKFTHT